MRLNFILFVQINQTKGFLRRFVDRLGGHSFAFDQINPSQSVQNSERAFETINEEIMSNEMASNEQHQQLQVVPSSMLHNEVSNDNEELEATTNAYRNRSVPSEVVEKSIRTMSEVAEQQSQRSKKQTFYN